MIIGASQVFDSDFFNRIVHMARPSLAHLQLLFRESPLLEYVLVTDCLAPLFQFDIRRIESERSPSTIATHVQGAFCVHRTFFDTSHGGAPSAPSWTELLGAYSHD
jgi:hypothetical protein